MSSVGIHAVFLLSAALAAVEHFVIAGDGSSDFACSMHNKGPLFDQVEGPRDYFSGKPPALDPPLPLVGREGSPDFLAEFVTVYGDEGDTDCGTCAREIAEERQGRVRYVIVLKRSSYPKENGGYWSRKRALANNQRGMPLLKSPAVRHALHILGLEVDSTCPDCARSLNARHDRY